MSPNPGTGLRMVAVEHLGNRGRSLEEANEIAKAVASLLADGTFTDRHGAIRTLSPEGILVVAPCNAQVRCLRAVLPENVRVGTVDKFQGQEAPIIFFSMATSTDEDVIRGMSFLFSRNRLNVAISRAEALAVICVLPPSVPCALLERRRYAAGQHALSGGRRRRLSAMIMPAR